MLDALSKPGQLRLTSRLSFDVVFTRRNLGYLLQASLAMRYTLCDRCGMMCGHVTYQGNIVREQFEKRTRANRRRGRVDQKEQGQWLGTPVPVNRP